MPQPAVLIHSAAHGDLNASDHDTMACRGQSTAMHAELSPKTVLLALVLQHSVPNKEALKYKDLHNNMFGLQCFHPNEHMHQLNAVLQIKEE